MAEHVELLSELEAELDRLRNPDEEESRMIAFIGKPIDELIAETEKRIEWRRNRKANAKCLHCGATDITRVPDADEFAHPMTGERVIVAGRGFVSTAEWHAEFTTEGELITSIHK